MGGKRSRRGKHFYISAAVLTLSLLFGCVAGDLIPWGGRDGQHRCLELFEETGTVDRTRFNTAVSEIRAET